MRSGRTGGKISGVAPVALTLALCAALPLTAQPVGTTTTLPVEGDDTAIVDVRAEAACEDATLPGALCLPAAWLFDAETGPIAFHQLRWLLGTLGLSGDETLLVFDGAGGGGPDAWAAAGLVHLAGQMRVLIYDGALPAEPDYGETRGLSREAIYTVPLRTEALAVEDPGADSLRTRLADYARRATRVAFAPET